MSIVSDQETRIDLETPINQTEERLVETLPSIHTVDEDDKRNSSLIYKRGCERFSVQTFTRKKNLGK